ncbi:MAG: carboxypeptidase regulatory-like domain-containing protein [Thermoanaerobaculia bacterium]
MIFLENLMLTGILSLGLALAPPAASSISGSVSGTVTLVKAGVPRRDGSDAVVWIEGFRRPGTKAVHVVMKSEQKKFTPHVVAAPRAVAVEFPNEDPIYHNVFSVSGSNRFDLGLYRSGVSRTKEFDQPGLVQVYCNIHPQMIGYVMIVDSDCFAVTGRDGSFRFRDIPAGDYELKAWHEEGGETRLPLTVRAEADTPVTVAIDVSRHRFVPHKNKYGKDYPPQAGSDDDRY